MNDEINKKGENSVMGSDEGVIMLGLLNHTRALGGLSTLRGFPCIQIPFFPNSGEVGDQI